MMGSKFLFAAYVVTWTVHIVYVLFLTKKAAALQREYLELKKRNENL